MRLVSIGIALTYFVKLFSQNRFSITPILGNNFSFGVGFASSIKNFGRVLACAVFNCACKMGWLNYLSNSKSAGITTIFNLNFRK